MSRASIVKHGIVACMAAALLLPATPPKAAAQGLLETLFGSRPMASGNFQRSARPAYRVPGHYVRPQPRHVVRFSDSYGQGTVIVSFGDRRLYYVHRRGEAISYPIGVPTGEARWAGTYPVSMKRVNPPWTPTVQMRRDNPELPAHVPGGHPRNPMGVRALYLGDTLYRIHGTDAPWTIGNEVSRGCIRLYNEDVIDLYDRVGVGARVIVTWDRYRT